MKKSVESVVAVSLDLSRHRSMIKRVQLTLTLLSRIANSLNEENFQLDEDLSMAEEYQKALSNKLPLSRLTSKEPAIISLHSIPVLII